MKRIIALSLVISFALTGCGANATSTGVPNASPAIVIVTTLLASETPMPTSTTVPPASTPFPPTYTPRPTPSPEPTETETPQVDYVANMKAWTPDFSKYANDISSIIQLVGDDTSIIGDPAFKRDILDAYQKLKDHVSQVRDWKAPSQYEALQGIFIELADRVDAEYDACTAAFKDSSTYELKKCTAAIKLRSGTIDKLSVKAKRLSQ